MATVKEEWGMACPECGRDDCLEVEISTMAKLTPDGTTADEYPHEWDRKSYCRCTACEWEGEARDCEGGGHD